MDTILTIASTLALYALSLFIVLFIVVGVGFLIGHVTSATGYIGGFLLYAFPSVLERLLNTALPLSSLYRNTLGKLLYPWCVSMISWTNEAGIVVNHPYLMAVPKYVVRFIGFTGTVWQACLEIYILCIIADIIIKRIMKKLDARKAKKRNTVYRSSITCEELNQRIEKIIGPQGRYSGKKNEKTLKALARLSVETKMFLSFSCGEDTFKNTYIVIPHIRDILFIPISRTPEGEYALTELVDDMARSMTPLLPDGSHPGFWYEWDRSKRKIIIKREAFAGSTGSVYIQNIHRDHTNLQIERELNQYPVCLFPEGFTADYKVKSRFHSMLDKALVGTQRTLEIIMRPESIAPITIHKTEHDYMITRDENGVKTEIHTENKTDLYATVMFLVSEFNNIRKLLVDGTLVLGTKGIPATESGAFYEPLKRIKVIERQISEAEAQRLNEKVQERNMYLRQAEQEKKDLAYWNSFYDND